MSKVIVITGASSGIGESAAKILGKRGDKVVLGARRTEKLEEISKNIENANGEAAYIATDVTNYEDVKKLAKLAVDRFGRIDVWINNAGIMALSPIGADHVSDWDAMIDINIKGVLYGISAALPYMKEKKSGQIINISSIASHRTDANSAVYSGTKFAVLAISEGLRQEQAASENNIRVTSISPGAISTELTNSIKDKDVKASVGAFYDNTAIPVERVTKAIQFAIDMDEDTSIDEILFKPSKEV